MSSSFVNDTADGSVTLVVIHKHSKQMMLSETSHKYLEVNAHSKESELFDPTYRSTDY